MNDLLVFFSYYSMTSHTNKTKFVTRDRKKMLFSCNKMLPNQCYRYFYMCSNQVAYNGPDTYDDAARKCQFQQSSLVTPSVSDRKKHPDKSFWTGTKRLNSSHFISETGQVSSFSNEVEDWQNFLPAVQLQGILG